jgi:CRAL/TRIO domain
MDKVYDSFEKALIFVQCHPSWFDWQGENLQRALDLYSTGFLKVLKQRDAQGRRIIIGNNHLDMGLFNADDVFRLHCLVILLLAIDEETQVSGAIYVDDFSAGITMKYLTMYPLKSIYDFTLQLKVTPIRLKNIILIGLPGFASQFLNVLKHGLSHVMHERFHLLDEIGELWKFVDKSIVTTDYGGEANEKEAIEDFRIYIDDRLEDLRNFFDFEVDMSRANAMKNNNNNNECIGSFRKLEID